MISFGSLRKTAIITLGLFLWFSLGSGFIWSRQGQEDTLAKARQLLRNGDYEGAIKLLEDYIAKIRLIAEQKKNVAEAYYIIAKTYYIVGEAQDSEANLKRAFETYPTFAINEPDLTFRDRAEKIKIAVLAEQKGKAEEKPVVKEKEPEKEQPVAMGKSGEVKKRKFPWLIVGGIVIAAGVAAVFLLKKKGSQNGAISVSSSPIGAKVYLDGSDTGQTTNCTLSNVTAGSHSIKLVKEGYQDYQQSVVVSGGQTASVNASLTANTITVTSPTSSTIWEKGFEVEIKWTTDSSLKKSLNVVKSGLAQILNPSDFNRKRMQEQALLNQGRDSEALRRNPRDLPGLKGIPEKIEGENPVGVNNPNRNKNNNVSPTVGKLRANPENLQLLKNLLSITNVDIDLYKGGTKVQTIVSNQSNSGSYKWIPPGSLADGSDYRVRVSCSAESGIYGESSNYSIATHTYQFIAKWGSYGTGDGQFHGPEGIAIDSSGNVYVCDSGNNRVQKFTSSGSFLAKWGSLGTGDGQFNGLYGIAIDSSGNVYVADYLNYRIQKFTSSGSFLAKWGSQGTGDGQFNNAYGIAVDNSGNVYVLDTGNHCIQKFTSSGSFLAKWGSSGTGDGQFKYPYDIAVDSFGNVYVADTENYRVQKFTSSGSFLAKWGSQGTGAGGEFDKPRGIAVDNSGNVYVVDTGNYRIQKFTSSGSFLEKWGGTYGSGDGQFMYPKKIAVDSSGYVFVCDLGSVRIQKFR